MMNMRSRIDIQLWLIVAIFIGGLFSLGLDWYRDQALENKFLSRVMTDHVRLRELVDQIAISHERVEGIVRENKGTLALLEGAREQGPRNTACDAKKLLADLRGLGISVPTQPVEERCK